MDPSFITLEFLTLAVVSATALLALRQIQSAREALTDELLKGSLNWLAAATLTTYLFVVIRSFVLIAVPLGDISEASASLIENYVLPAFIILVFVSVYFTARAMWQVGQTFGRFKDVGEDLAARMAVRKLHESTSPKPSEGSESEPAG